MATDPDSRRAERPVVLVVDDEEENLLLMRHLLRPVEAEVVTAESGAEGIEIALHHEPALILLDVRMPEMDGFETARRLRAQERTRYTPIIFITAVSKEERFVFQGYESGAVDYLFKPVNVTILRSKVNVFIDLHRQRRALARQAELERAYRELREQHQKEQEEHARQSLEALGRLAGGIAHDVNNQLFAINGYAEMLARAVPDRVDLFPFLREIRDAGERAAELTRRLLSFSCRDQGNVRSVDANAELERLRPRLAALLGSGARLEIVTTPDIGRIRVDPRRLDDVILNLAANAADAMPEGGTLTFETESLDFDEGSEFSPPLPCGRYVVLRVMDTGRGMEEEVRRHIFEPFFTTRPGNDRIGLGLATVHGIVAQCEGQVFVESEPGEGSRFTIYLPRFDDASVPETGEAKGALRGSHTIMVVDDQRAVREMVAHSLRDARQNVLVAENGQDALRQAAGYDERIDLLLTDVIMPGMTGPDLAARFPEHHPESAVLFMSGYTADALDQLTETDRARLVRKPISMATLQEAIVERLAPTQEEPAARATIVVAAASATTRLLLQMPLEEEGYEVHEAGDARATMRTAVERRADLVVASMDLDDLGGIGLAKSFQQSPILDRVPVVLVLDGASAEETRRAQDAARACIDMESVEQELGPSVARLLQPSPSRP